MLDALITSKTRVRLLVKFFLNPAMSAYLRELADEFGESTNAVRVELNRLTEAGVLESEARGNVILYRARHAHPLFPELKRIVSKFTGIDQLVEEVVGRLGKLEAAYLIGDYAAGRDSGIIDLLLVGNVDKVFLLKLVEKAEELIRRRVRYLVMDSQACADFLAKPEEKPAVLLWSAPG